MENKMELNRLKNMIAYLSGPIDFSFGDNHGKEWRDAITPFLESLGVNVLNPLRHQYQFVGGDRIPLVRDKIGKSLKQGRFHELREDLKEIVHMDLRSVDLSSFVICNYNTTIHMCGTYEEIFKNNTQVKPTLLVSTKPKTELSSWIYARFPPEHIFKNWDELKKYLTAINSDPDFNFSKADLKRWLFLK